MPSSASIRTKPNHHLPKLLFTAMQVLVADTTKRDQVPKAFTEDIAVMQVMDLKIFTGTTGTAFMAVAFQNLRSLFEPLRSAEVQTILGHNQYLVSGRDVGDLLERSRSRCARAWPYLNRIRAPFVKLLTGADGNPHPEYQNFWMSARGGDSPLRLLAAFPLPGGVGPGGGSGGVWRGGCSPVGGALPPAGSKTCARSRSRSPGAGSTRRRRAMQSPGWRPGRGCRAGEGDAATRSTQGTRALVDAGADATCNRAKWARMEHRRIPTQRNAQGGSRRRL